MPAELNAVRSRRWAEWLPAAAWLTNYPPAAWRKDLLAGLVMACLLVPQGMAYAGVAGLEPQFGLYAAAAGLLGYALFGTSRQLVVSPTSSSAAILAAAVAPLAAGDMARYAALASCVAITTGFLFLAAGGLRLGFVSEFISRPVLRGFMFGLAITIAVKQLPALLGVPAGSGDVFARVFHLLGAARQVSLPTLGVGVVALALLFALSRHRHRFPPGLLVLVLGIAAVAVLHLDRAGVAIVGNVTGGLPAPRWPDVPWRQALALGQTAAGILLIVFTEAIAAGRTLAAAHDYEIEPDRELKALGVANLAAGLFQGITVGGGASGAAANDRAGARTQLAAMTACALVVLTLLFLTPLFRGLPQAVLAALVIHAVWTLADPAELRRYVRLRSPSAVATHLIALLGVLLFGVLQGMMFAAALSIVLLLWGMSVPVCSVLGRLPGTHNYVSIERHPEAERLPGLLIFRVEAPLFYANANYVLHRLRQLRRAASPPLRALHLNCDAVSALDVTSLDMLAQLRRECEREGVALAFTRVRDPVRARLQRAGLLRGAGGAQVFLSQHEAVKDFLQRAG